MTPPSPDPATDDDAPLALTRRRLLAGASFIGLTAALTLIDVEQLPAAERGEPFDDGTWFDDGYGWVD